MHFHGLVISHHPGSCLVLFFDDCSTSLLDPRCFSGEWGRKHGQVKHSESWGGGGDSISRCQARCDDGPQTQRRKKKGLGGSQCLTRCNSEVESLPRAPPGGLQPAISSEDWLFTCAESSNLVFFPPLVLPISQRWCLSGYIYICTHVFIYNFLCSATVKKSN